MNRIDVVLLGWPQRLYSDLKVYCSRMNGTVDVKSRKGDLLNLSINVDEQLETVARLFDAVHYWIRHSPEARRNALMALRRMRYYSDPACRIPVCDAPPCAAICGGDQWSTPQYWGLVHNDGLPFRGDCDDIEMQVAGMGEGLPLFVRPNGRVQGHVMHLAAPYSIAAMDYCIPAGMAPWKGPRECFFFFKGYLIEGTIRQTGPQKERFSCQW